MEASYDSLFHFSEIVATNKVVVVQMNENAARTLKTKRQPWERKWHTKLLKKLTTDHCSMAVFDVLFLEDKEQQTDDELANAMRDFGYVVLMADLSDESSREARADRVVLANPKFADIATNWGIARLGVAVTRHLQDPVRRHWRDPLPDGDLPSLPRAAAQLADPTLKVVSEEQWLRYYADDDGLELIPYDQALDKPKGFFTNRVVFIGNEPPSPSTEPDAFLTPKSLRDVRTVGGVEIHAITFQNLTRRDWLRPVPEWVELLTLGVLGALLGAGLSRLGRLAALGAVIVLALFCTSAGVALSHYTNFLFPWLIVVGGQLPCALVWALVPAKGALESSPAAQPAAAALPDPDKTIRMVMPEEAIPDAPEYEIITPPVGKGGFGKVWIARNAVGQWQALKAVYQSNFGDNRMPYEMEFKGLQRYKPVSEKHPGLLRIDLVSKMKPEGYFYYVMELGDAQAPGWEKQPTLYRPRDLENLRKHAYGHRLPVKECLRVVTVLADALDFLHKQGLTHRDIKPSNVIFVNGRPKLADIGLVSDIRPVDQVHTIVGTLGFMPPPPEKPGTAQADIYSLGMLLYVISTGSEPGYFPDVSTTLMEKSGHAEFIRLNAVILKACQPDLAQRYQTTSEMLSDLQAAAMEIGLN